MIQADTHHDHDAMVMGDGTDTNALADQVKVEERLGHYIDLEALFLDVRGRPVTIGDIFDRPVVLLPPAIGWTAVPPDLCQGTGSQLLGLMLVLGIWQVPHFLILAAAQPVQDPGADRFPSVVRVWTKTERCLQILIWVCVYSLGIFWFLLNGGMLSPGFSAGLAVLALILPLVMGIFVYGRPARSKAKGFAAINLSMFLFMVLGILDRILPAVFPL